MTINITGRCEVCLTEFVYIKSKPSRPDILACSKKCSYKLRKMTRNVIHDPIEKTCLDCKAAFLDTSKKKLVDRCRKCVNAGMVETRMSRGSYVRSEVQNKKLSETLKQKYVSGWDPNTAEHREKLSTGMKERWQDGSMREQTAKTSMEKWGVYHHTQRIEFITASAKFSFAKKGYRHDLNIYFRSAWEANFARYLNFLGKDWSYEPKRFLLKSGLSYTPDFYVITDDIYYEVKGAWIGKSREKVEDFIREYGITLVIIEREAYDSIKSKYSKKIIGWEL